MKQHPLSHALCAFAMLTGCDPHNHVNNGHQVDASTTEQPVDGPNQPAFGKLPADQLLVDPAMECLSDQSLCECESEDSCKATAHLCQTFECSSYSGEECIAGTGTSCLIRKPDAGECSSPPIEKVCERGTSVYDNGEHSCSAPSASDPVERVAVASAALHANDIYFYSLTVDEVLETINSISSDGLRYKIAFLNEDGDEVGYISSTAVTSGAYGRLNKIEYDETTLIDMYYARTPGRTCVADQPSTILAQGELLGRSVDFELAVGASVDFDDFIDSLDTPTSEETIYDTVIMTAFADLPEQWSPKLVNPGGPGGDDGPVISLACFAICMGVCKGDGFPGGICAQACVRICTVLLPPIDATPL